MAGDDLAVIGAALDVLDQAGLSGLLHFTTSSKADQAVFGAESAPCRESDAVESACDIADTAAEGAACAARAGAVR